MTFIKCICSCGRDCRLIFWQNHYPGVIMSAMASQITSLTSVYSIAQIKEYIKAPRQWLFVRGIHRCPVNSPHKGPATWKMFTFDDVIMYANPFAVTTSIINTTQYFVVLLWWLQQPRHKTTIWGLWCQKQVSQVGIRDCTQQYSVRCNYLSMSEIPSSGAEVHIRDKKNNMYSVKTQ